MVVGLPAVAVLERIGCSTDDEGDTRSLLRELALFAIPHRALTQTLSEVIGVHDNPGWLVEVAAQICDHEPEGINMVVDCYKELLSRGRSLLVPVIGSLGELPLPDELKVEVLGVIQGSLGIVEDDDVPTVIHALLVRLCPPLRPGISQAA